MIIHLFVYKTSNLTDFFSHLGTSWNFSQAPPPTNTPKHLTKSLSRKAIFSAGSRFVLQWCSKGAEDCTWGELQKWCEQRHITLHYTVCNDQACRQKPKTWRNTSGRSNVIDLLFWSKTSALLWLDLADPVAPRHLTPLRSRWRSPSGWPMFWGSINRYQSNVFKETQTEQFEKGNKGSTNHASVSDFEVRPNP